MTRESEELALVRKLVVVFDICSSTSILEDLKQTDNLAAWRNLLICLKEFLLEQSDKLKLEPYKFIGDGWIILLPPESSKTDVTGFLRELSIMFDHSFDSDVNGFLQRKPNPLGLTFGMDAGELIRLEMDGRIEYLGRAINVASRLQGAVKELNGNPGYQALFSKNSFNSLGPLNPKITIESVKVSLRNISNGDRYECLKYQVL